MHLGSWNVMVGGIGLFQNWKIEGRKEDPGQTDLASMGEGFCLLLFGEDILIPKESGLQVAIGKDCVINETI